MAWQPSRSGRQFATSDGWTSPGRNLLAFARRIGSLLYGMPRTIPRPRKRGAILGFEAARIAFGATQDHVLSLVLKQGLVLASIGLGFGMVGAFFAGRALRGLLYGVASVDSVAFSAVAVTLFAAAFIACYIPARRAAKVDPMVALRCE